ncbi:ATP-binding protein [Eubacterium sp. MSJ-13]|uniref:AAA family ATPase n=1 Tax=Eubacterium sp. MSJ-13 TaxID=2841513 RepID=UPI001C116EAC|nr:ATP-binding protein [Eubacterium sp. MSJ-13]MBU5479439.1 ATP-binding protein [Eubacterium sp. MSJ-13]
MKRKNRVDVKDIKEKEIVRVISIGQKNVCFRLQNAYEGQVGDNTELLDETVVDGMLEHMTAEAVAKALNKKVYHINYSELESKYVGETPKNIRRAFECAARDDAVLIFDEADSFLGKRT